MSTIENFPSDKITKIKQYFNKIIYVEEEEGEII